MPFLSFLTPLDTSWLGSMLISILSMNTLYETLLQERSVKQTNKQTKKEIKKINLYLPSAVFIAQVLVGPSKRLKQIFQIEHNIVKNPNWPEANQLAIYKRGRGFELGATEKQTQVLVRAGLEPETAGLRVRRADRSATLPPRGRELGGLGCVRLG